MQPKVKAMEADEFRLALSDLTDAANAYRNYMQNMYRHKERYNRTLAILDGEIDYANALLKRKEVVDAAG